MTDDCFGILYVVVIPSSFSTRDGSERTSLQTFNYSIKTVKKPVKQCSKSLQKANEKQNKSRKCL